MTLFRLVVGSFLIVLAGCASRPDSPIVASAIDIGTPRTVFAATPRAPLPDGGFGPERSEMVSLLEMTVSIPPTHSPGTLSFGHSNPNPKTDFTLASEIRFASDQQFRTRIREELEKFPPSQRDVTVFVHGFNTNQTEAVFRAAQLAHDIDVPGIMVVYSWPSLASPLGYAYDGDSAIFARDGLEKLLRELENSNVDQIVLAAHSMGSLLTMETLRQIEISSPGWSDRVLDGVVLLSPDLDVDVFRSQMSRFETIPDPFVVFVSQKDKILNLSQRLRGTHSRERLGTLSNPEEIADLPIEIVDMTGFAGSAESGHFITATSPALLALLNAAQATARAFGEDSVSLDAILPQKVLQSSEVEGETRVIELVEYDP